MHAKFLFMLVRAQYNGIVYMTCYHNINFFSMVQNFIFSPDSLASAKLRTTKIFSMFLMH